MLGDFLELVVVEHFSLFHDDELPRHYGMSAIYIKIEGVGQT